MMAAKLLLVLSILNASYMVSGFRNINFRNTNTALFDRSNIPMSYKDVFLKKISVFPRLVAGLVVFPSLTYAAGVAATKNERESRVKGYLTDPTDEFKLEQKRTKEFRDSQMKYKQKWDGILENFETSTSPADTEAKLNALTAILVELQSIPIGVKKLELVKTCRKKKFNGKKVRAEWTTPVEIAYQKLIQEFNKQVLPNNKVTEQIF